MLFLFGSEIIILVVGENSINVKNIYYILIFTIITNPFGPLFTQTLIVQKLNKEFRNIVRNTFIFNILLAPIMIYLYDANGLALVVVLTQILVITLCIQQLVKARNLAYV